MTWNTNIAAAPRGRYVLRAAAKGKGHVKTFEPAPIILATKCGTVTVSHYLPDAKRWEMMSAGEEPIAWAPFPGYREYVDAKGRARRTVDLPAHPTMAESWFAKLLRERRAAA